MDLFGDIDDISSESDNQLRSPEQPVGEHGVSRDQSEDEAISETRIEVEIPSIKSGLGSELHFVKLPKFLSIEPKPFDPKYYEDELENEQVLSEEERARLKLKIENTIRWRIRRDEKGNKMKESNTRIVKWSDGSISLHLGSEVFDVSKVPLQGNYNHLFIREDTGLQGQAVFKSKLTFRPHSTDSATHRNMTLPLARRLKSQKITLLPMAGCDPECQRTEMIKREERLRAQAPEKPSWQGPSTSYLDSDSDREERGEGALTPADAKGHYQQSLRGNECSRKRKAGGEVEED